MPDIFSKSKRSSIMALIRSTRTGTEMKLIKALKKSGMSFRTHVRGIPGTPDIVFPKAKLAVFVDGNFWHGFDYEKKKKKLSKPWREKIETNIKRDRRVRRKLRRVGWDVLRVWGHEVERKDLSKVVEKIGLRLKKLRFSKRLKAK